MCGGAMLCGSLCGGERTNCSRRVLPDTHSLSLSLCWYTIFMIAKLLRHRIPGVCVECVQVCNVNNEVTRC